MIILLLITIVSCGSLCYDVWDESFDNIHCNMFSKYFIDDGIKLFYKCCNTFPSKNCQKENYTKIYFDNFL